MEVVNLLKFLNNVHDLYTLEVSRCNREMVNFLDLMTEDEQFTRSIDLGLVYLHQRTMDQYTIVDGLGRIVSLSLLLHAICECYKKTTQQNEKAIKTIRSKYLFSGSKLKLHLQEEDAEIYLKQAFEDITGNFEPEIDVPDEMIKLDYTNFTIKVDDKNENI